MKRSAITALWIFGIVVSALIIFPVLVVIPMSFGETRLLQFPVQGFSLQWYENFFTSPKWLAATGRSLVVAVLVALLATVLGTMASFALVRGQLRSAVVITGLVTAPMIVPYVVFGAAIYAIFLNMGLVGTTLGFVIAHTVLAVPYVVVNVTAALQRLDPQLERASASLGAHPLVGFAKITLPLILPSMLAGTLFAFMISFDEVVVALFVSGPGTETLPVLMWSSVQFQIDPTIAAVSTLLILVTTIFILIFALLQARMTRRMEPKND